MHPIFYYILIYLLLGAIGMLIANRKTNPNIRRQRWLKYFFYVLITGAVIASIFFSVFKWVSIFIVSSGFIEMILVNVDDRKNFSIGSLINYGLLAFGFTLFAFYFTIQALLFIYFQVLIFDAFGQITGQLFGKNLLAPAISPTKTVEGLVGGWLFCIASAVLGHEWVNLSVGQALIFGLLTGLTSFCGDMLASWFKRLKEIKDYSNWLPGQGGFLDRFDSFIFTGAVYFSLGMIFKIHLHSIIENSLLHKWIGS
jgi:phosphatidate cytidylyltransferase